MAFHIGKMLFSLSITGFFSVQSTLQNNTCTKNKLPVVNFTLEEKLTVQSGRRRNSSGHVSSFTSFFISLRQDTDLSLIHISEPTRPLYISYAVFCLKKKKKNQFQHDSYTFTKSSQTVHPGHTQFSHS
eukprot:TRINITY_DN33642_c0_g1_i3.p1 TRINITY_DN33642_c0_g1~~TRINITY_DN33642_c0_g1_i3.p1  ORF type:complete len:129 (+),score=10.39 TRINITY_DN33642_c0_g1_i3:181-567(+)